MAEIHTANLCLRRVPNMYYRRGRRVETVAHRDLYVAQLGALESPVGACRTIGHGLAEMVYEHRHQGDLQLVSWCLIQARRWRKRRAMIVHLRTSLSARTSVAAAAILDF
jgi:hypothetical protein